MGRREIKRSNTSGSTTRSYDSGSATTNFVGKFTQSVRRIVQDVKDEGAPSGMTRDEVIETNERLRSLRLRLEESYETAKKALINLMNKYGDSKSQRNIFQRYPMLKLMIKEVIRLETQYWTLVDIPRQEKQETVPSYVMRACSIMEKTQKSGEGVKTSARLAEEAAERRERMERLEHMTTAQIEHENTQLINDLYRLLKKYLGLRHLIRVLKVIRQLEDVSHISTLHNAKGHDKRNHARSRLHGGVPRDAGQRQLSRGHRKWQASHECHLRGPKN
ncbi:uncharacterized protein LOC128266598 isoform X1 [Drosophila gunungcola]|uniref:uncharacterized protein LOC128266598 isoform X1 n=1 Tax=Drosophila gunungcola TaxID=103775 RepID=UPI0022E506EA|nr:uncharacterized protein LOC128266598 isoform X1 [Drosophila gunungcola]